MPEERQNKCLKLKNQTVQVMQIPVVKCRKSLWCQILCIIVLKYSPRSHICHCIAITTAQLHERLQWWSVWPLTCACTCTHHSDCCRLLSLNDWHCCWMWWEGGTPPCWTLRSLSHPAVCPYSLWWKKCYKSPLRTVTNWQVLLTVCEEQGCHCRLGRLLRQLTSFYFNKIIYNSYQTEYFYSWDWAQQGFYFKN